MRKKSILSRIGSTILADLTAISIVTTSIGNVVTVEAATGASLATTEQIVGRAASLLGTKYSFGAKGGNAYGNGSIYSPWTLARQYGIDCSGFVWWTLNTLGYSTSGFGFNNPVPVDTYDWEHTTGTTYVTRGGGTSQISPEKISVSTSSRPYWEKTNGSTIRPGSIVIGENPGGIDHAWIYIGEFDTEAEVETYVENALKKYGAANATSYVTSADIKKYVQRTNGNCKHWRIESNGDDGVVVNNGVFGKANGSINISTYPITLSEATFALRKVEKGTSKIVGLSPIINAVNKNAIYNVYDNASCSGTPVGTITIGSNGVGSITLPYATKYWVKEKIAPTGYLISNEIYAVSANSTSTVEDEENHNGTIIINKRSPDGDLSVANRTFEVKYVDGGKTITVTGKTDSTGKYTFDNLPVYDIGGTNTAIEFTVSEILTTTEQKTIIQPAAQKVKLNALAQQDFTTTLTFDNYKYGDAILNKVFIDNDGTRIANATELANLRNECSFGLINSDGVYLALSSVSDGVYKYRSAASTTGGTSMKLDANGKIRVTDLPKGTYKWHEFSAPTGFTLASDTSFTISNKNDVSSTMRNSENTTNDVVRFYKQLNIDGVNLLELENLTQQEQSRVAGLVAYQLYGNTKFRAYMLINGQKVYLTGIGPADINPSINNGQQSAVMGWVGHNQAKVFPYTFDTTDDSHFTTNTDNATPMYAYAYPPAVYGQVASAKDFIGTIEIHMESPVPNSAGNIIVGGNVDSEATARYNAFVARQIYIEEVQTANPEIGAVDGISEVKLSDEVIASLINDTKPVEVNVIKKASDDMTTPVAGATYTAKAVNDCYDQIGRVIYNAGDIVETAVTDENGVASFSKLKLFGINDAQASGPLSERVYVNKYEITETEAPINYNLSGNVFSTEEYADGLLHSDYGVTNSAEPLVLDFNDYEEWQTRNVSAHKYDNYTDSEGINKPLAGAVFVLNAEEDVTKPDGTTVIYHAGDTIETVTTDSTGTANFTTDLPVSFNYSITEVTPPVGYILHDNETTVFTLAWVADADEAEVVQNYDWFNDHQSGTVSVYKVDKDNKTKYLSGAEFTLYAGEDIAVNDFVYSKDAVIDVITTANPTAADDTATPYVDETKGEVSFVDVPVGFKYYVKETKAPDGYILDDNAEQTFDLAYNKSLKHIEKKLSFEDDSIEVDFAKTDVAGSELPGATVQVLKKEKVNKAEDESQTPIIEDEWVEYDKWVSTSEVHRITAIPAGDYIFHEVAAPKGYMIATDIAFTVTDKGKVLIGGTEITAKSTDGTPLVAMADKANIVDFAKEDAYGDELPGASVQLLNEDGTVYEEWTSTETAHRITAIPTGKYTFHEVAAPKGYCVATDIAIEVLNVPDGDAYKLEVKVNGVTQTSTSTDGTPLITMVDEATKVWFYKLDENGNNLPGAKLKIVDNLGNVVKEFTSDVEPYKLEAELTAGLEYKLIEDEAPGGYYYSGEVGFTVSLNGEIDIVNMEDTPIIVELSKKALTGEDELPGALIQVLDENNNVIDEWTSTDVPHIIDHTKLIAGKSYTMHEVVPAPGYNLTSDIGFDISKTDNGKVVVLMRDSETHVEISKNSKSGSYEGNADVIGARLQIIDKNGTVVEEWTTDGTVHVITAKLISGETYTLHEAECPSNYTPAEDITFTVSTDGSVDSVSMIDQSNDVDFAKIDEYGEEVEGATVQVLNEDGTVYEEWESTDEPHRIVGMPTGKYTMHEVYAPDGYTIATDIDFIVATEKVDGVYKCVVKINGINVTSKSSDGVPLIEMVDKATKVWFYKLDEEGNNLAGAKLKIVDNLGNVVKEFTSDVEPYKLEAELTAGLEYKLIEDEAPGGYYYSGEVSFTVSLNGEIDIVNMEDTPIIVELSKKALTGEDELPGALIQVFDDEGNKIDEWLSTDKPHIIDFHKLIAGKSYTMHEVVPAPGYNLASDIDFSISKTDEGKVVVLMKDSPTHVEISKNSDNGEYQGSADIIGARLQIIDKDGNVVEEWVTDGTVHTVIAKLISGETYTLHEAEAPENYQYAEDIEFTVSTDGSIDTVEMFDNEKVGSVKVVKTTTENKNIEGITFILDGTTNTGREIRREAVTDENGEAFFNNIPIGSYVVKEDPDSVMIAYTIADAQNVTVETDKQTVAEFHNLEKEGTVHVVKRTEGDLNVEGIKFVLNGTSDSGREIVLEAVTDENGNAVFENVPIGTYEITEDGETVPSAYLVAEPQTVEVLYAETTDASFLNLEKTGSIHIQKRTEGDYNVKDIRFILSGTSDSGREIMLEAITDENGDATFANVPIGTYEITEDGDTVPTAYLVADPETVTVSYAKTIDIEFLNLEKTGSIHVVKRTEGDLNVEGIKFILFGTSDSGREIRIEAVTDKNGDAVFENVPIGTYEITEDGDTVPTAYLVADPVKVTVTEAKTIDTTVFNKEKTGSIKVQKKTEGMTDISGIKFILSGTSDSGREIKIEAITDENGVATFKDIPIGTYEITEDGSSVPTGYLVADAQKVTVVNAETKDVTFVNEKKPEQPQQPEQPAQPGTPNTGMTEQEQNDNNSLIYLLCAFFGLSIIISANAKKRYYQR